MSINYSSPWKTSMVQDPKCAICQREKLSMILFTEFGAGAKWHVRNARRWNIIGSKTVYAWEVLSKLPVSKRNNAPICYLLLFLHLSSLLLHFGSRAMTGLYPSIQENLLVILLQQHSRINNVQRPSSDSHHPSIERNEESLM